MIPMKGRNSDEILIDMGDQLNEKQKEELLSLLNAYEDVFSFDGRIGCTATIEHKIEIEENTTPIYEPLRRHAMVEKEEISRQTKDMLDKGILNPA